MKLCELMKVYSGNACISIEDCCEEASYDYYQMPVDEHGKSNSDLFSGNNPNHYIPTCLEREPWWKAVMNKEVTRWSIIGGGMYKAELRIYLTN